MRVLLIALLAFACKEEVSEVPPPSLPAEPATPPPAADDGASAELTILDGNGGVLISAKRKSGEKWTLKNATGEKIGKVKVQADRVKVKDAGDTVVAKVKKKDNGFKLLGRDENLIFKAKYKGEGELKLKDDGDTEYGRLTGLSGTIQGKGVTAEREGDKTVIKKDGKAIAEVRGDLPPEPTLLLGFDGLDAYQKIGLLVFVKEVL